MRKLETTVLKSTDKKRVGVQEILGVKTKPRGPVEGGNGGGNKPTPPRKSLEERIINVLKVTVPSMITEALKPVVKSLAEQGNSIKAIQSDISDLKTRMIKVEQRLDKQDEFNQYVKNVFEKNKLS